MQPLRRPRLATAGAALVLVTGLASACASGAASPDDPVKAAPSTAAKPTSGIPTPAVNRAAAVATANQLLAAAPLPPGAKRIKAPASLGGLAGPALGTPLTSNLVDVTQFYRVPLTPDASIAWLQKHRPHGTTVAGTSSGTDHGVETTAGIAFAQSTGGREGQNQPGELSVATAPKDSGSSIWRVDGTDIWFNPTPVPDHSSTHTLHVDVSTGCPATLGKATDVVNAGSGLTTRLLPSGSPTAALECGYGGLNSRPGALVTQRHLTVTAAQALARKVRAIVPGSYGEGAHSCPADFNEASVVAFAYPGRNDLDLWWHSTGCPFIDNGVIVGPAGVGLP